MDRRPGQLNRALRVRSGEEPMVALTVGLMFATWAGFTVGQSSIDALLFAKDGVDELPVLYLLLGALLFVASLGVTALLGRMARERLFTLLPLALAALLVVGWLAAQAGLRWVYPALWLFVGLAFLVQGSYLWGIAGLVTDTRQAKRLFPLFGAGGIAGAALGGLVTQPLAAWLQPENLLLLWAGVLVSTSALARVVLARWGPGAGRIRRPGRGRVTALGAIREGYRTVRRSDLLRWMSAGAVLMSVLLFTLYLPFSRAALDRFPDAAELAGFLGVFSGISTGVALLISLFVANRLYSRFGTPVILLAYAIAYAVGFGVLVLNSSFALLVAVRFFQVVWMQGLANSAWEAMINVTPPERRDHARAFLNGVPTQAGTALAGVILIVGQTTLQPEQLFVIGFAAAVLTAFTMWQARRSYATAVAETLRNGRPHVFETEQGEPFAGIREDAAAVSVAVTGLSDPDPRVRRVAAEVLGTLRNRELVIPLRAALDDPDAGVRASSVRALGRLGDPLALSNLEQRLTDTDASVRLAAVYGTRALDGAPQALEPLLDDPDPAVRAEAAVALLGGDGPGRATDVLRKMSSDEDPDQRRAAIRALRQCRSAEAGRLVAGSLEDPLPPVRATAAAALADIDPGQAVQPLVNLLVDPDSTVRAAAARALGGIGRPSVPAVVLALDRPESAAGALMALEHLPADGAADVVRRFAGESARQALRDHQLAEGLSGDGDERRLLLRDALARSAEQHALRAIRAVAVVSSDRSLLSEAIGNLEAGDAAQRAAAVELIDSSKDAATLRPLVAVWESGQVPIRESGNPISELLDHPDPWIRECAEFAMSAAVEGNPMARTLPTLAVMERVLFLRKAPMFEGLPPEDLKRIAAVADESVHQDGDVIVAEGEAGSEMHIIVSGEVAVVVNDREPARRSEGDVVGELAVITDQPRMATLVASGEVRLLTIGQRQFAGILRERPETSLAVMRVLARRLTERERSP
jgi:HEAT repeat protein/ATP/ADP translocase